MPEGQSVAEVEPQKSLADEVRQVFERRATKGERKLIFETYQKKLNTLIQTMPKEQQRDAAIKIQEVLVLIRGFFAEYSARFTDLMRKIFLWPMIKSTENFPKDKYYQIELARAQAWGDFAWDTTKTATSERTAYRDHFLSSALSGAQVGGAVVGTGAIALGAIEGAKIGAVVGLGLQGAAAGAAVGGAIGGIYSGGLYLKDKILGPPVAYYDLFSGPGIGLRGNISSTVTQPIQSLPVTQIA